MDRVLTEGLNGAMTEVDHEYAMGRAVAWVEEAERMYRQHVGPENTQRGRLASDIAHNWYTIAAELGQ